jgi:hypothetical protein
MLKGNLSTRPFYNERLVSLLIATAAIVVGLLTIFNATRLVTLSAERRRLRTEIAAAEQETTRFRSAAVAAQASISGPTLERLAASAREANTLIDQRTFSWTAFFGLIEQTMPIDVRLVAVNPRVDQGAFRVVMTVVARSLGDIDGFVDALLTTGAFYDVAPTEQQTREDGALSATIEAAYLQDGKSAVPGGSRAPRGRRP